MTPAKDRASEQMNVKALRRLAEKYKVELVGDARRSEVKRQWVQLINAAITIAKTNVRPDNVIEIGKAREYYQLDDLRLEGYVSFQGYAVHSLDYSRYLFPDDFQFQKPVYRFIQGHGYKKMNRGLNLVIKALRANAEADLKY